MSEPQKASTADWIAVFAGALGALVATLDISIVNSALPEIQGEIGATGTEGTWISTGYLVSEVVIIPLTAWLTRLLGTRTLLLISVVTFTVFSMTCGLSHSLPMMILGRVGQGFTGGALIPAAQTIIRTRLPARQMPVGMAIFGLIVLLGPLAGPVLGGWLTENVSWRWCFFINLPVAIGLMTLLLIGLKHEKIRWEVLRTADWLGILGLATCLSSLTVVLEEGQREQWFDSDLICILSVASVIGFILLMVAQATAPHPVIKLRLLLERSYASVIVIVLTIGTALYGMLYVLPQFLGTVSGYNALQTGRVLVLSGIPAFLLMPILPRMLEKMNLRISVIIGLLCFAGGCFLNLHLTGESDGAAFVASQLLIGTGQMLSLLPLNQASVGAVSKEDAPDAAGLYNMARNLGGSIGLALLGTFIDRRDEFHTDILRSTLDANAPLVQERLSAMTASFARNGADQAYAQSQALASLSQTIDLQSLVMTYSDCFWVLGVALLASIPLTLLLKTPRRQADAVLGGH
ncbi:MAG TPA: DHA2 family efflux MFS transporter permease subunit [Acidisoma sp.]|uniref:DHA2 family efflux MFS transporter permease subunit n=1 Tax=Acidisoma sp. TaxID=1872115 RepID=UPI002C14C7B8|nr:DHA2 family efflux MFS transporter permease subunit [Acidisoma sp.]HTI00757.1 DHA2 family efflux MFS transporter permease subunit [Acidisoma sp.]